jgi:viroplasmin and RNaseH domain-containing protein
MDYLKIKGHLGLLRDRNSHTIINTNMNEYDEYIKKRKIKHEENQKIQNLEENLVNMKGDINEIKNLLRSLLDGPK